MPDRLRDCASTALSTSGQDVPQRQRQLCTVPERRSGICLCHTLSRRAGMDGILAAVNGLTMRRPSQTPQLPSGQRSVYTPNTPLQHRRTARCLNCLLKVLGAAALLLYRCAACRDYQHIPTDTSAGRLAEPFALYRFSADLSYTFPGSTHNVRLQSNFSVCRTPLFSRHHTYDTAIQDAS